MAEAEWPRLCPLEDELDGSEDGVPTAQEEDEGGMTAAMVGEKGV